MNSDLNSDSKQCTESKLGRVHRVHTQRTLAPHALRLGRVHSAVSWSCPAMSQRARCRVVAPSSHDTKVVLQLEPCRVPCSACRSALVSYCGALLRSIATPGALCRNTRPAPPVTIQPFVSRHTLEARPCARAAGLAVSWPCPAWPCTPAPQPPRPCLS